ncbi:MAG: hypothetical protein PWQ82_1700 [Thermosediminibacterales bacterium]|nr:hypothetical protein [Thermosediminibacterales bacterium]
MLTMAQVHDIKKLYLNYTLRKAKILAKYLKKQATTVRRSEII